MAERWYLYGDDPGLALDQLQRDLVAAPGPLERAELIRYLPNLGAFDQAHHWLVEREPALLDTLHGRATLMRLQQHWGDANPWMAMLAEQSRGRFEQYCDDLLQSPEPLDCWLGGGLGDQLECLARLPGVLGAPPLGQRLRLVFPEQCRQAMEPLLQRWWPSSQARWCFDAGEPRSLQQRAWISRLPLFALLTRSGLWRPATPVAGAGGRGWPGAPRSQVLCCWRSKVDPEEKLWAHLRSLPFFEILQLYHLLVPWAAAQGLHLVDLTRYRPEEARGLARFAPTLQLAEPQVSSLADTADLLLASRGVISVDTALVHLAGWFDWPTLLLLHQHPDERWQPLIAAGGDDGRRRVLQQDTYNRWGPLLQRLLAVLPDWPPVLG